jgi:flagellar basal body-associated protein FliL
MFVTIAGGIVAGGVINARINQPPDYVLKDGRFTVYVPAKPVPPPKKVEKEKPKPAPVEPPKPALFYSMDPPLVVNFEDSSTVRFLQIGMDVMARDPAAIEAVQRANPLIRNNLLMVISNRDYQKLMSREGKEELRKEALAEIRKILKKEAGAVQIEDLLFTSFVVQ